MAIVAFVLGVVALFLLIFMLVNRSDSIHWNQMWMKSEARASQYRDMLRGWEERARSAESKLAEIKKLTER